MKVLKALIEVNHEGGGTNYLGYPQVWLDNKESIPAILYPENRDEEIVIGDKLFKVVFPLVPEEKVAEFLAAGLELADPIEVEAASNKHWPKREVVNDQAKLNTILLKVARKETLTPLDEKALDPNDPESGVIMTKNFVEIARDYGADNV